MLCCMDLAAVLNVIFSGTEPFISSTLSSVITWKFLIFVIRDDGKIQQKSRFYRIGDNVEYQMIACRWTIGQGNNSEV